MLPNIESIEYVYIMHARGVMQQKKKKEKEIGKFNWVRQGVTTEVMFTVGEGNRCVWMSEIWE